MPEHKYTAKTNSHPNRSASRRWTWHRVTPATEGGVRAAGAGDAGGGLGRRCGGGGWQSGRKSPCNVSACVPDGDGQAASGRAVVPALVPVTRTGMTGWTGL